MSTKPTLPRAVADAIERKRAGSIEFPAWSNADFIEAYLHGIGETQRALRTIPVDTLMAALINGYEVEKSAEELAEEARQRTKERIRLKRDEWMYKVRYARDSSEVFRHLSFIDGMKYVLNELGEKIPGVNAPEGESV